MKRARKRNKKKRSRKVRKMPLQYLNSQWNVKRFHRRSTDLYMLYFHSA